MAVLQKLVIILLFIFGVDAASGQVVSSEDDGNDSCDNRQVTYTVEPGDKLYEIGDRFGSMLFWEAIYIANADLIEDPDLIYVGQQFEIPFHIAAYTKSEKHLDKVLQNPFCSLAGVPLEAVDRSRIFIHDLEFLREQAKNASEMLMAEHSTDSSDEQREPEDTVEKFREAFEAVVEMENEEKEQSTTTGEDIQRNSERQMLMELDGMVLDETRSKVGRDFYDVFYTHWESPQETYNFSIRVMEQPSPSLGTIIYVEVNDTETFRMRLQPRYDFIQQAARYAVRQTYRHLQNNDYQVQIY